MKRHTLISIVGILLGIYSAAAQAKTVTYNLRATRSTVNLSGKSDVNFTLQLNGSIPAPTLTFTEGDDAEITVHNDIAGEELSIHWHGVLLPPEMDGVPYVTTPPIRSGESFTFRFPIRQNGTYWYHSHTNLQEQLGLYGALIFHPQKQAKEKETEEQDVVAILSDWSDENAQDILKNLRKDGDYYLYKKNTVRSWAGAIAAGNLGTYLSNEWSRMGGMDLSDVGYDAFLVNGKKSSSIESLKPHTKVRLRIINAGASTYFYVSLGQSPMKIISADGMDISPTLAKEVLLGMAETVDALIEIPDQKSIELKASSQDGTGSASLWLGAGEKVPAPIRPAPDLYAAMDHNHHSAASQGAIPSGHEHHGAHPATGNVIEILGVDQMKSADSTKLTAKTGRTHEMKLVLGGDMSRYVWHINGKAIHEEKLIVIHEGDLIRFEMVNETMMHHPMHLHGHFFRVLNGNGDFSPLKHTVDVPPHQSRTIEFLANEPGEWMLHCHNLYHMKTGMARVVKYSSFTPKPEMQKWQKHDPHGHDHWYFNGKIELATNHAQANARVFQTWNQVEARFESAIPGQDYLWVNRPWTREGDLFYRRWMGNYFSLVGGGTSYNDKESATAGASYVLPLLIRSQFLVNHRGQIRLDAEKRFQWTKFLLTDVDLTWRPKQSTKAGSHDLEYEISLLIAPAWEWAAGLMFTDDNFGVGVQFQF